MTGSKRISMATNEMHATRKRGESQTDLAKVRAGTPYVWDGKNEDDRPLTNEEMQAGIEAYRKQRDGRLEVTRNRRRSVSIATSSPPSVPPAPAGRPA